MCKKVRVCVPFAFIMCVQNSGEQFLPLILSQMTDMKSKKEHSITCGKSLFLLHGKLFQCVKEQPEELAVNSFPRGRKSSFQNPVHTVRVLCGAQVNFHAQQVCAKSCQ